MKDRLIPKMLALLTVATITTSTLTGCHIAANQKDFVEILNEDVNIEVKKCVFVIPQKINDNYFISLIGHYDTADKFSISFHPKHIGYENHKDYRITYKVSEEDYLTVNKFVPSSYKAKMLSQENLSIVEKIVYKYDPIEVVELNTSEENLHEEIDDSYFVND